MRRVVVVVLALFGGLALLAVVVALVVGIIAYSSKGSIPRKTILEVDFDFAHMSSRSMELSRRQTSSTRIARSRWDFMSCVLS